jgi:hypothetical protein
VFIFKDTEPSPLQDSFGVRQKGDLLGPPPRSPASRIHRCPGGLRFTIYDLFIPDNVGIHKAQTLSLRLSDKVLPESGKSLTRVREKSLTYRC